ncbi:MAG: hypothetical protein ABIJ59_00670 [Pseudomonadota bacterium]
MKNLFFRNCLEIFNLGLGGIVGSLYQLLNYNYESKLYRENIFYSFNQLIGDVEMKKLICTLALVLLFSGNFISAWAFGEGPSGSGRWVEGRVVYSDGSKCKKCCSIKVMTENGISKEGCTDSSGYYKIYVASNSVKKVFFRGSTVWSGSESTKGGVNINISK